MEKVIVDYNNLRDAEMLSFARIIIQHMDKNPPTLLHLYLPLQIL